jgi:hypothetical protein
VVSAVRALAAACRKMAELGAIVAIMVGLMGAPALGRRWQDMTAPKLRSLLRRRRPWPRRSHLRPRWSDRRCRPSVGRCRSPATLPLSIR